VEHHATIRFVLRDNVDESGGLAADESERPNP
jgi:hypothetical protein